MRNDPEQVKHPPRSYSPQPTLICLHQITGLYTQSHVASEHVNCIGGPAHVLRPKHTSDPSHRLQLGRHSAASSKMLILYRGGRHNDNCLHRTEASSFDPADMPNGLRHASAVAEPFHIFQFPVVGGVRRTGRRGWCN